MRHGAIEFKVLASLAFCGFALAGCGQSGNASASDSPNAGTGGPSTKIDDYAQSLTGSQGNLEEKGYSISTRMVCKKGKPRPGPVLECRTIMSDSQRAGAMAFIDFEVFDYDVTFSEFDKDVEASVKKLGTGDMSGMHPNATWSSGDKDESGKLSSVKITGNCHQILGDVNSPALCGYMFSKRIFITAGEKPSQSSSKEIVLSSDGPDFTQDMARVSELAGIGWKLANMVLS